LAALIVMAPGATTPPDKCHSLRLLRFRTPLCPSLLVRNCLRKYACDVRNAYNLAVTSILVSRVVSYSLEAITSIIFIRIRRYSWKRCSSRFFLNLMRTFETQRSGELFVYMVIIKKYKGKKFFNKFPNPQP